MVDDAIPPGAVPKPDSVSTELKTRQQVPPPPDAGHIPITEEMDSARWTLPPMTPVIVVVLVLGSIIGAVAWLLRAKPVGAGGITAVFAVEQADHANVMVALHVRLQNVAQKPLWIRNVKATLKTDQGQWNDDAASAVDYQRYFQAFPELAQQQIAPLAPESKLPPGAQQEGMVIVSFPVSKEQFDKRNELRVTVEPYDQRPVIIQEQKQ